MDHMLQDIIWLVWVIITYAIKVCFVNQTKSIWNVWVTEWRLQQKDESWYWVVAWILCHEMVREITSLVHKETERNFQIDKITKNVCLEICWSEKIHFHIWNKCVLPFEFLRLISTEVRVIFMVRSLFIGCRKNKCCAQ